jgi:hypothetical protein
LIAGQLGLDWKNSKPMTKLLKAWDSRDLNQQHQGPNWKHWKFDGQLMINLHKSGTKDLIKKGIGL